MDEGPYRPEDYWSDRLQRDFNLRGTGHIGYSVGYNRWLYRAKGRALRRALSMTGREGPALDLGSGTGWVIEQLLRLGIPVSGSDLTDVAVEGLRERFPGVRFDQLTVGSEPFPFNDATLRLITALDVLYHVVDDREWAQALGEAARVLEPGGHLIVTDGLGPSDANPAPHVRKRGLSTWTAAAANAGLDLRASFPLFRWLSREDPGAVLRRVPGAARGPVEYALERVAPVHPHMRCAVFVRTGGLSAD